MSLSRIEELTELLNEYETEFTDIFNSMPDIMVVATQDTFEKVNDAFIKETGWPREDLEGCKFMTLVHPDDYDETKRLVEDTMTQAPAQGFINRYRTKDGCYIKIQWNATKWNVLGKTYAVGRKIDCEESDCCGGFPSG